MTSARRVTFELSEDQARWIDERVAEGAYPDQDAALQSAVDRLVDDDPVADLSEPAPISDAALREAVLPAYIRMLNGTGELNTAAQVSADLDCLARDLAAKA